MNNKDNIIPQCLWLQKWFHCHCWNKSHSLLLCPYCAWAWAILYKDVISSSISASRYFGFLAVDLFIFCKALKPNSSTFIPSEHYLPYVEVPALRSVKGTVVLAQRPQQMHNLHLCMCWTWSAFLSQLQSYYRTRLEDNFCSLTVFFWIWARTLPLLIPALSFTLPPHLYQWQWCTVLVFRTMH